MREDMGNTGGIAQCLGRFAEIESRHREPARKHRGGRDVVRGSIWSTAERRIGSRLA